MQSRIWTFELVNKTAGSPKLLWGDWFVSSRYLIPRLFFAEMIRSILGIFLGAEFLSVR